MPARPLACVHALSTSEFEPKQTRLSPTVAVIGLGIDLALVPLGVKARVIRFRARARVIRVRVGESLRVRRGGVCTSSRMCSHTFHFGV